jgi:hypothetical protein
MDNWRLVNLLVDGLGVMDGGRLDGFTLNNRLDWGMSVMYEILCMKLTGLVDVVVLVGVDVGSGVNGRPLYIALNLLVLVQ